VHVCVGMYVCMCMSGSMSRCLCICVHVHIYFCVHVTVYIRLCVSLWLFHCVCPVIVPRFCCASECTEYKYLVWPWTCYSPASIYWECRHSQPHLVYFSFFIPLLLLIAPSLVSTLAISDTSPQISQRI
jgi:hypothetical protein